MRLFPQTTRDKMTDTITAGAEALGKTSHAIGVIVSVAVLALLIAAAALIIALKGKIHAA